MNAVPVADRSTRSAPPPGQLAAPLAGVTVTGTPVGTAGAVALHHLRALGARHRPGPPGAEHERTERLTLAPQDGLGPLDCEVSALPDVPDSRLGETAIQALSGVMAVNGRQGDAPRRVPLDYVAVCAGVLAVQGVLAALIARTRGTPVRLVRTAHSSAALLSVSQYLAAATAVDVEREDRPSAGLERTWTGPPFRSRDGVWFELETLDSGPWREFWAALGLRGRNVAVGWRSFVGRYATAVAPLPPLLHDTLGALDFADIASVGDRTGLSVCRIRTTAERHAQDGPPPAPWTVRPAGTGRTHPASPGARPTAGQPLRGMTVVEATRRVQGPLAGHILRMLGAHVIRVEPPGGDPMRGAEPVVGDCSARFLALNHAKSVVEADLKSAEGRRTVRRLAWEADVFLHNWAPGKAEDFGLDAEELCSAHPRLVYAHASGWGPSAVPDLFPGTDFMVQARSGLAWDMAVGDSRPRPTLMTVTDVLGGLVSAEGVLAGLLARERTGRPQRVDTSLLSAASILQRPEAGRAGSGPESTDSNVEGPYRTSSGHIALTLPTPADLRLLCEALHVPATLPTSPLRRRVAAHLATRSARSWIEELGRKGIEAVHVHEDLAAVAQEPRLSTDIRPGACALVAPPWRFQS